MNLLASTFRNGEFASLASRRASSVLPTPVGPIIRMFFGITSSAISGSSFWRRMRLRSAMATARLASALADDVFVQLADDFARRQLVQHRRSLRRLAREDRSPSAQLLVNYVFIRIDADLAGDRHGFFDDLARAKVSYFPSAPWRRPWRKRRRSRWRRCRRPARSRRRCR